MFVGWKFGEKGFEVEKNEGKVNVTEWASLEVLHGHWNVECT
jgi:hypothetical protein